MWQLDHEEGWATKNWCFQIVVLEKTLERPLDNRKSNQSILKEIKSEYLLEGLMMKLKLQYLGHLMRRAADSLVKTLMLKKDWGEEEKGETKDEMIVWHHWFNQQESEQTPGDTDWAAKFGMLQSMRSQSLGQDLPTEQQ